VREGKVRALGASNYPAPRLADALAIARREGFARFAAVQDHHNLVHRSTWEGGLAELCTRERLAFLPYYALAQGFLTGKYRREGPASAAAGAGTAGDAASPRRDGARRHLDARGERLLAELDRIAAAHATSLAAVALAWLRAQPNVVAPIASARTTAQLAELLPMATLPLTCEELQSLTAA
jgi:aryl-alcohol dehydrogenase (NADP+)